MYPPRLTSVSHSAPSSTVQPRPPRFLANPSPVIYKVSIRAETPARQRAIGSGFAKFSTRRSHRSRVDIYASLCRTPEAL